MKMISVFIPSLCNSFYLTVFLKYFVKLSNNYKYKLEHCISIKECWGHTLVYTHFYISIYMCVCMKMQKIKHCKYPANSADTFISQGRNPQVMLAKYSGKLFSIHLFLTLLPIFGSKIHITSGIIWILL